MAVDSPRRFVTVMIGDVPLYDASIDAGGNVFIGQPYTQPAKRPVRYERVQLADLERSTTTWGDQSGHGRDLTIVGTGSRMRLRCGRCGVDRDHVVGDPLPPCPGACGATANPVIER